MKKNSIEKRIRQYNTCKFIEYAGYLMMVLSFLFLLGIAGTSDMYDEMGVQGPPISTMLIQFLVAFTGMFTGYIISKKGKEWVEINKKRLMEMTGYRD